MQRGFGIVGEPEKEGEVEAGPGGVYVGEVRHRQDPFALQRGSEGL